MKRQYPGNQYGLSLIELMVAIALSALLMLGVTRMFADSLSSNATDTALSEIRESARIAMELLKADIRQAGFQGDCVPSTASSLPNSVLDFATQSIGGTETAGTGSDELMVFFASDTLAEADVTDFSDNNGNVLLGSSIDVVDNDIFLVSDCQNIAIFTPTGNGNNTNSINPEESIDLSDMVLRPNCIPSTGANCDQRHPFYKVGTVDPTDGPVGLVYDINGTTLRRDGIDMVDGIENMQILYGIANNNALRYCNAQELTTVNACNPANIRKVRISLVAVSRSPVHPQNTQQSLPILNTVVANRTFTANDRLLRRVFTTTVNLRNRG